MYQVCKAHLLRYAFHGRKEAEQIKKQPGHARELCGAERGSNEKKVGVTTAKMEILHHSSAKYERLDGRLQNADATCIICCAHT